MPFFPLNPVSLCPLHSEKKVAHPCFSICAACPVSWGWTCALFHRHWIDSLLTPRTHITGPRAKCKCDSSPRTFPICLQKLASLLIVLGDFSPHCQSVKELQPPYHRVTVLEEADCFTSRLSAAAGRTQRPHTEAPLLKPAPSHRHWQGLVGSQMPGLGNRCECRY